MELPNYIRKVKDELINKRPEVIARKEAEEHKKKEEEELRV